MTRDGGERHHRRSIRLKDYDYAQAGAYFVTVCTQQHACLFGQVVNGEMRLNDAGEIVRRCWVDIPAHFPHTLLDAFVIMPNHVHGVIVITGDPQTTPAVKTEPRRGESGIRPDDPHQPDLGDHKDRPYGTTPRSLGRIVQAFKSTTTHEYVMGVQHRELTPFNARLWQRNYHEHVIRDEAALDAIRQYIVGNPARWAEDPENPEGVSDEEHVRPTGRLAKTHMATDVGAYGYTPMPNNGGRA